MVDLVGEKLAFPLHDGAAVRVSFIRTLRVPDTGTDYNLPAGFGHFPVRRMETLARLDASLKARGGIAIPMWQAEALWILFETKQPAAIKIGAGRINALTGKPWQPGLHREPQDYVVAPDQPWLDGFVARPGIVRQFVAVPLGYGATVAEQVSDDPDEGGIQIVATPLTQAAYAAWKEREARIAAREGLCESE